MFFFIVVILILFFFIKKERKKQSRKRCQYKKDFQTTKYLTSSFVREKILQSNKYFLQEQDNLMRFEEYFELEHMMVKCSIQEKIKSNTKIQFGDEKNADYITSPIPVFVF